MANKENGYLRETSLPALLLLFVLACMSGIFFFYSFRIRTTTEKQAVLYLQNSATESEKLLSMIFSNSKRMIKVVSQMYEEKMTAPTVDYRELLTIRKNTNFDFIRFINKEGIAIDSNGNTVDATNREYFQKGIKGESGISPVMESAFSGEYVIVAYAPLYYKGEILGIFSGVHSEGWLTSLLNHPGYAEGATTYLCLKNGDTFASSLKERPPKNLLEYFNNEKVIDPKNYKALEDSLENREPFLFNYHSHSGGKNTAYIVTGSDNDWVMLQTFPEEVTNTIVEENNQNVFQMELFCVIIFLVYIVFLMYSEIEKRKKSDESNRKKLLKSSQNLEDTVAVLSDRYYKVLKCDLSTGLCETIKVSIDANIKHSNDLVEWAMKLVDEGLVYHEDIEIYKQYFNLEAIREKLKSGEKVVSCTYRRLVDGVARWVKIEIAKSSEYTEKTPIGVLYLLDIDEDVQKELALKESYESAVKANKAKTQFLSAMSHDIRTPMHAILGMTSIAEMHLNDSERIKECLQKITVSSRHLLQLINDVLDMSKIESGRICLSMEEFNLSQLLDNLLTMTREQIVAKHQELEVAVAKIQHEMVVGDSQRIQQVFMNIMSNAIKYTPENGKIRISITEKHTNKQNIGCYEFVFEDNGVGMSKEYLKHIFNPFSRAEDDERVRKIQGTGLGLSICHNIVQMMNGDIKVESELNKGTKFTITIFLQLQADNQINNYESFKDLPVLVIDDDVVACQSACEVLGDLGMKPSYVLSGAEAIELIQKKHSVGEHFFAIIVDWKMPEMDGLETTKKIRELAGVEIPIIIISAYDWTDIENDAKTAGANDFISKPLFKSRLAALFHKLTSDENQEEKYKPKIEEFSENDFKGKRVLLTEDIELIAEMTTEILKMANLEVEVATNGKEALEKVAAADDWYYDLIFMDIQMPIMNGYEAATAIRSLDREYTKTVPIIAMSANAFSDDIIASKNAGMDEHIGKPFEFENLVNILNKWLNKGMDRGGVRDRGLIARD